MAKKDSSLDLIVIRGIIKQKPLSEYHDFFSGTNLKKQIRLETLTNHVLDLFKIDCINAKGNDKTIVKYLNAIEIIIGHYSAKDTKIDKNLEARLVEARTNLKEMLESEGRTLTEEMEELLEKTWKWSIGANLVFPNMEAPEEEVQEETEVTNEEVELLKQKVQETEEELKQTKKELSKSLRSNTKVEGKVTSLESMISELREKNKTQKEEVDSKEKEIKASKKEITKLNEEIEALLRLKAELEEQTSRVESQERTIEEQASELKVLREKDKSIDDLEELEDKIIELVSAKEYTLDELQAILANDNKRLSLMELKKVLKGINTRIKIETDNIKDNQETYKVSSIVAPRDKIITMPGKKVVNMLVISDLHLGRFGVKANQVFDGLYDYAIKNNIGFILNLGDFYSYDYLYGSSIYDRTNYNELILNETIRNMPYDKRIHQAILGGNHDKHLLSYGVDPIERLSMERADIINLGYDHAIINIGEESLSLYHKPFRFQDDVSLTENLNNLKDSITLYDKLFKEYEEYVNLFGHFHSGIVSDHDGIICVPSLTNDRFQDGCYHLQIEMNEQGKIEDIIVINVVRELDNNLSRSAEMVYKRR